MGLAWGQDYSVLRAPRWPRPLHRRAHPPAEQEVTPLPRLPPQASLPGRIPRGGLLLQERSAEHRGYGKAPGGGSPVPPPHSTRTPPPA